MNIGSILKSLSSIFKSKKNYIYLFLILVILAVFLIFKDFILFLFDLIVSDFFMQLFFPNCTTLLIIFIIMNFSIFNAINKNYNKLIKYISFAFYILITTLLIIIFYNIKTLNLDINDIVSLYSNKKVLILAELTTFGFLIYIIIMLLKYCFNNLLFKTEISDFDSLDEYLSKTEVLDFDLLDERLSKTEVLDFDSLDEHLSRTEVLDFDSLDEHLSKTEVLDLNDKL